MTKLSSRALVVAAFAAVAVLYYYRLGTRGPSIWRTTEVVMFGVVAHDIAWHARDVDGNFLPAFMHMNGVYWNMYRCMSI